MANIIERWDLIKLENLLDFYIGGDWGEQEPINSNYIATKVLRATDISNWENDHGENAQIRYLKDNSLAKRQLKENDLIIEVSGGSPDQPVGRTIIISSDDIQKFQYPVTCSNFFRLLRFNNKINPKFINYYFKFLYETKIIESYQSNSTNLRNLKFSQFLNQNIPVPQTLDEQQEIVKVLDAASEIIRLRTACIESAQFLIPALFQEMFGDPLNNNKNLTKEKIGKIFTLTSGKFIPSKELDTNGQYPVYGGNGINGYHNEFLFEDSKICIGRVGVKCGCVHKTKPNSWITDNALYINNYLIPINETYLKEALTQINLNQYAKRAAQPVISQTTIYNQYILLPQIEQQELFATKVQEIESYIKTQQVELENAKTMFQSLLHHSFTGELTRHKFGGDTNG